MSVNLEQRTVGAGDDDLLEEAWALKERIRRGENVLKQRRAFFARAYKRSVVHAYRDPDADELVGFAAVRGDGYILFLAVHPDYRGDGFGERLVAHAVDEHPRVTCHARTTNGNALDFYRHLGFEVVRRIDHYYEDGGDAFYLRLGESSGLADRLSSLLRR